MGTKPKTRFIVKSDGKDRALFSIRVSNTGDLRILPDHPRMAFFGDNHREIGENHTSVHNSNGGKDTSITVKQQFKDGGSLDYVAYLADTADNLLWPLIARRVGVSGARPAKLSREKDTIIRLPQFSTMKATLFYTVFVSAPGADFSSIPHEAVTVQEAKCGRFTITVLSSFINIPSHDRGHIVGATTSSPTDSGVRLPDHFQIERSSLSLPDAINWHWHAVSMLRAQMLTLTWPAMEGRTIEDMKFYLNFSSFVTAVPII